MTGRHVNDEGAPLRDDGTPFPDDPSAWTPQEREYLEQYAFSGELETDIEHEYVAQLDIVPEMHDGYGEAYP